MLHCRAAMFDAAHAHRFRRSISPSPASAAQRLSVRVRHPRCARWFVIAALALASCDGPQNEPIDFGVVDAAPLPSPCDDVMLTSEIFEVARCDDRARMAIRVDGHTALVGVGPAVETRGRTYDPTAWPDITWRRAADGLTIDYEGLAQVPSMRLDLQPAGTCLEATLSVESASLAALDDILAIWQGGEANALETRGLAWTLDFDGRPVAAESSRRHGQPRVITSSGGAIVIAAVDPVAPVETIIEGDADGRYRLSVIRGGPHDAQPGIPIVVPWVICAADFPAQALDRFGQYIARRVPIRRGPPIVGLALPAAGDAPPDVALIERTADWLRARTTVEPTIRVERGWYRTPGDWADTIWPANGPPHGLNLQVSWPLLQFDPAGPLVADHPDWQDLSCDCARFDPRIPAVREHLTREALALRSMGIEPQPIWLWHLAPVTHRSLLAALAGPDGVAPSSLRPDVWRSSPPPGLGLSPVVSLPANIPSTRDRAAMLGSMAWVTTSARIDLGWPALVDVPPDQARQEAALALLAGVRLINHDPDTLMADPATAAIADALLSAPDVGPITPLTGWFQPGAIPTPAPTGFVAQRGLALFNWGFVSEYVPRPFEAAPHLGATRRVFDPGGLPLDQVDEVEIPPGEVVMWVTVDEPPAPE